MPKGMIKQVLEFILQQQSHPLSYLPRPISAIFSICLSATMPAQILHAEGEKNCLKTGFVKYINNMPNIQDEACTMHKQYAQYTNSHATHLPQRHAHAGSPSSRATPSSEPTATRCHNDKGTESWRIPSLRIYWIDFCHDCMQACSIRLLAPYAIMRASQSS